MKLAVDKSTSVQQALAEGPGMRSQVRLRQCSLAADAQCLLSLLICVVGLSTLMPGQSRKS